MHLRKCAAERLEPNKFEPARLVKISIQCMREPGQQLDKSRERRRRL